MSAMLSLASREAVAYRCRSVVASVLGFPIGEIEEGRRFAGSRRAGGMGADSLDLVCIAMEIEYEFGIAISDDEAEAIEDFGALVTLVIDKMADAGVSA